MVMLLIFFISIFVYGNVGGFDYICFGNFNFCIFDGVFVLVEGCVYVIVFVFGVSVIIVVVFQLKQGDLVFCEENFYGCIVWLFEQVFVKFGLKIVWVDFIQLVVFEQI